MNRPSRIERCRGLLGLLALGYDGEQIAQAMLGAGVTKQVVMLDGQTRELSPPLGALYEQEKRGEIRPFRAIARVAEAERQRRER